MEDRPYSEIKVGSKFMIINGSEPYLPTGGILTLDENVNARYALFSREDDQQVFCNWHRLKPLEPINDPVSNPAHYQHGGIETKEIIRTMLTPEEYRGYCKGNIIKYRERAEHKGNAEQDYEKAREYMAWLKEVE